MAGQVAILLGAYLIGATPFAYLLARHVGQVDVRRTGSGNVGAANVWRSAGPLLGTLVGLLDAVKGAAAVILAQRAGAEEGMAAAAGVCAVVGHIAPVWLGFHGGKGVATAAGVLAILAPRPLLAALIVFAATLWRGRYVSLASMAASVTSVVAAIMLREAPAVVLASALLCGLIVFRHRDNLARLRAGTELKGAFHKARGTREERVRGGR